VPARISAGVGGGWTLLWNLFYSKRGLSRQGGAGTPAYRSSAGVPAPRVRHAVKCFTVLSRVGGVLELGRNGSGRDFLWGFSRAWRLFSLC